MSAPETGFDTNDRRLTAKDVEQIENVEKATRFFAQLGYDVDGALPVTHSALGLDTDSLPLEIRQIHRIASDPDLSDIVIYLLRIRAVTVTLVQPITRPFATGRSWRCWC